MKKDIHKKLILNNRFYKWRLCILLSIIVSASFSSWTLGTFFEIIFSLIVVTYLFFYIDKKFKEKKEENGIMEMAKDAYDLEKYDLNEKYNLIQFKEDELLMFSKSLSIESEIVAAKSITVMLDKNKIFFSFSLNVIEKEAFKKYSSMTVREYLNYLDILKNIKFKNENDRLLNSISPIYPNPFFLKKEKGAFVLELITEKEHEKIKTALGFEYLTRTLLSIFLSMILIASYIPVDSFTVIFITSLLIGKYLKEKFCNIICADIVRKKEEFYKEKILEKLKSIKNGLSGEINKLKSDDKDLIKFMESSNFNTPIVFTQAEIETGISKIVVSNEGKDITCTMKINGEPINSEYLNLLNEMGLTINDAFTEDSIDLYELNFSF